MKKTFANKKARSFVIVMLVIALSALLLRVVVEQLVTISVEQNESYAQTTLKLISTALENYAKNNKDTFPEKITTLIQSGYLDKDYTSPSSSKGYIFSCSRIDQSGYNCSAVPLSCNLTGKTNFIISTGGLFISEKCAKRGAI